MINSADRADVVMLGTFSAWRLGTIQARALPIAQELARRGLRVAIITTPWDEPHEAGILDSIGGVRLINTRTASIRNAPIAVAEMVRHARTMSPRLIHVFKPRGFGGLAGRLLEREFPVVVDVDDWEGDGGWNRIGGYSMPMRRVFDWQERSLIQRARVVTAASTLLEVRARRLRQTKSDDSVVRVTNGLTTAWADALGSPTGSLIAARSAAPTLSILIYSRFEELSARWLAEFADALDEPTAPPLRIDVIGPVDTLVVGRAEQNVQLLGYVARNEIPSFLASATVSVIPLIDSLVSRSKQSVKLLELMAAGCAVVATDVGDVGGVLGDAGLPIRGGDPKEFARAARMLVADPDLRSEMSTHGRERVKRLFQIDTVTDRVLDAYREARVAFR